MSQEHTSDTTHAGSMRCTTRFTSGDAVFSTDIPGELGGHGVYPNPTAMLAASVASCMLSMIIFKASAKGINTEGISIRSTCVKEADALTELRFDITAPAPQDEAAKRILESAAKACPVGKAIDPAISKVINWQWV